MTDETPRSTWRLVFRTWHPDDKELADQLWNDPKVVARITRAAPTHDDAMQRLRREIANQHQHGYQYWPMFTRDRNVHVGCCGLKPNDLSQNVLELGFHLRPEHWRSGYAAEAGRAVIAHAFDQLGADALFAGHHPDNAASRKSLLRLGFTYTHDALFEPTGLQHPSYILTADTYRTPVVRVPSARYAHTNLIAHDERSLMRFYERVFGCIVVPPVRDQQGEWLSRATAVENAHLRGVHLRLPGHGPDGPTLEIYRYDEVIAQTRPIANRAGFGHLAFAVDDVETALESVIAEGGRAVGEIAETEVASVGTLTVTYAADPEGNLVELQSWSRSA